MSFVINYDTCACSLSEVIMLPEIFQILAACSSQHYGELAPTDENKDKAGAKKQYYAYSVIS